MYLIIYYSVLQKSKHVTNFTTKFPTFLLRMGRVVAGAGIEEFVALREREPVQ